jgi:molybdate transport system regulatory protein
MFKVKGRIWIEGVDGTIIGAGRIELLEQIKESGSISEAAKAMGMSYRHAWEQIDQLNRQSGKVLVERQTGGQGGGGSTLTAHGEKVIQEFKKLNQRFLSFTEKETEKFEK